MAKGGSEPQGGGGGGGDTSLDFLWIVVSIIIATLLIWYYGQVYITKAVCWLRFYEIVAIKVAIGSWIQLSQKTALMFHLPIPDLAILNRWQEFAVNNKEPVEFNTLVAFSTYVGQYLRYPVALILLLLIVYLYVASPTERFKNIFTTKQLRLTEQEDWPQIMPVAKLDLVNVNLDKEPWAMALNPMRFCEKYGLIKKEKEKNGQYNISLIHGAAYRILGLQLGPRWRGYEAIPMYLQALFAVFITRIDGEKKVADKLEEQLAASASSGQLNFTGVKELIEKHKNNKTVQRTIAKHAYVTTVMASLLVAAREAGVLASAEFIWLKTLDRRMWYMLNNVGRPTAFAEISGAFAHWLAEKKLGLPLTTPMVDEAVTGLGLALKEILYKPKDED